MYPWLVYLHILGSFGFLLAHGTSASVAFALRRERNLERIRALLELALSVKAVFWPSLALLLLAGIIAGFVGRWWGQGWIWVSLVLLVLISIQMFGMGTQYFANVRKAAGLMYLVNGKPQSAQPPASEAEIDALLNRSPAIPLAATGAIGLLIILWLMYFKPF